MMVMRMSAGKETAGRSGAVASALGAALLLTLGGAGAQGRALDGVVDGAQTGRDGGVPPQVIAYDAAGAAAARSVVSAAAKPRDLELDGAASVERDDPAFGLNAAAPARPGARAVGAAFNPALILKAQRLESAAGPVAKPTTLALAIRDALAGEEEAVRRAYAATGFAPVWLRADGRASDKAAGLLTALEAAEDHALPAKRYGRAALAKRLAAYEAAFVSPEEANGPERASAPDAKISAAFERDLTRAYLRYASDLSSGYIAPRSISKNLDFDRPSPAAGALLLAARDAADLPALAASLPPQTKDYRDLLSIYAALRGVAAAGDWAGAVRSEISIRPLDRGPRIDALRERLVALGDLPPNAPRALHPETGDTLFDAATEQAVRRFQMRHGLAVDGVVGANTKKALNTSAAEQAALVAVNLERARWSNREPGARHIQVNIPDYHVDVMERGASIYRSRVVVGKRRHQTPEFSDEMTHVIVNPYWHVPYSIATEEFLPELREFPGALAARNIHVYTQGGRKVDPWSVDWFDMDRGFFPYRLRQGPGRGNALGEVKFIFPNHHAVYLHDTPSKRLFNKSRRAFSHGCIRVHKPQLLAETLLSVQSADAAADYRRLSASSYERPVSMQQPVPVHILYRTAWVDQRGGLQLREDIYGRDARILAAMRTAGLAI